MLAFIHVAKTGGQTVETLLASSYGAGFCIAPEWKRPASSHPANENFVIAKYNAEDLRRLQRVCPWLKCVGGHPVTLWSEFESVTPTTWFALVREPLARGASHFQYNLQDSSTRPRPWREWIEWPTHFNHQVKMFSPTGDPHDAIDRIVRNNVFVGLTERFDESMVILRKLFQPDLNIAYRRTNSAYDPAPAKAMLADTEIVHQLKRMYADELILHEFITREWYPRFQKEYGPKLAADVASFKQNPQSGFNLWNYRFSRLNHHLILKPARILT
ncbi:MAG: hypothetical protein QNL91_05975 [Candidatus Krumholzibacteria bacterium]|nr:hypothetical protein [Candidatus Krumholzibacteria bacterium]